MKANIEIHVLGALPAELSRHKAPRIGFEPMTTLGIGDNEFLTAFKIERASIEGSYYLSR
jgi:hypothetical protein